MLGGAREWSFRLRVGVPGVPASIGRRLVIVSAETDGDADAERLFGV